MKSVRGGADVRDQGRALHSAMASDRAPSLAQLLSADSALASALGNRLSGWSVEDCTLLLRNQGRPGLLAGLRAEGVAAGHAQKVANLVSRALRSSSDATSHATSPQAGTPAHLTKTSAIGKASSQPHSEALDQLVSRGDVALLGAALADGRLVLEGQDNVRAARLLVAAVAAGQLEIVTVLLQSHAAPDAVAADGQTALSTAARRKHAALIGLLLERGAAVDKPSADGATPLLHSCRRGHVDGASKLIAAGADLNAPARNGSTPLHAASYIGAATCVTCLCDAHAAVDAARPDGSTALMDAAAQGHVQCVERLLTAGANTCATMHHGFHALLLAALHGHASVATLLCEAGAMPVDSADVDGTTPLTIAAQRGHAQCVRALIMARADMEASRADGMGALAYAALGGHAPCVRLLVLASAALSVEDGSGWSPILYAAHGGHLECIRLLVAASASADHARSNGFTPLMAAAAAGRPKSVLLLRALGATAALPKRAGCYLGGVYDHAALGGAPEACARALEASLGPLQQHLSGEMAHGAPVVPSDDVELDRILEELLGPPPSDRRPPVGRQPPVGDAAAPGARADTFASDVEVAALSDAEVAAPPCDSLCLRADPHREVMQPLVTAGRVATARMDGWREGRDGCAEADGVERRVVFRPPPLLTADECWQERPVRIHSLDSSGSTPFAYRSNSRAPHAIGIVHLVLRDHGFERVTDGSDRTGAGDARWSLYWYGGPLDVREVHQLLPHQKVSKFPLSNCLTLKARLWQHYATMRAKHGPGAFGYMPPTFVLPAELDAWRAELRAAACDALRGAPPLDGHAPPSPAPAPAQQLYIVKPNNASRSRGIYLTAGEDAGEAGEAGKADGPPCEGIHGVVCAYLPPYLIDGTKFDLRLFALVTSWHPLVVYRFSGGIARFATEPYTLDPSRLADGRIHLTNFSMNPRARRMMLSDLQQRLESDLGGARAAQLWRDVDDLVVKTMVSVEGPMAKALASCSLQVASGRPNTRCFQLFGLDVLIDAQARPWLLEVRRPSCRVARLRPRPPRPVR